MGISDLPQSVPICLVLAAAGGVVEVFATAVLAWEDERSKVGVQSTPCRHRCALAANTTLQILASILGNLFAPWFGPVSLVAPMFLSAQLVANMVIFGFVLGIESFSKDMKIGTYVIVVASLLLPVVGPQAQENQDVMTLISNWYSLLWLALLICAMVFASVLLNGLDVMSLRERVRIMIILSARAASFTVNLTVSRIMVLKPNSAYLAVSLVQKILSGAVMTHAIVVQSTAVRQALYVPLNACTLITVNALTGIVIWEDYLVVVSWIGYIGVFILLLLGSYLLLGDFELLGAGNSTYGIAGTLRDWTSHRAVTGDSDNQVRTDAARTNATEGLELSEKPSVDQTVHHSNMERQRSFRPMFANAFTNSVRHPNSQSWMHIYGIYPTRRPYRQKSLFTIDTSCADDSFRGGAQLSVPAAGELATAQEPGHDSVGGPKDRANSAAMQNTNEFDERSLENSTEVSEERDASSNRHCTNSTWILIALISALGVALSSVMRRQKLPTLRKLPRCHWNRMRTG